jgi:hypothetical protein
MKDLFAYLFGDSQVESEVEETKAVIEKIMEEAEEQEPLKVKRTPLIAALKALGLKDVSDEVQYDPEGFCLVCKEESEYREYVRLLMEPDAMEKLAKLGWVVTRCGDVAMSNEPAEFRIRFLEITSTDDSDKDSWPTQNDKLMKSVVKKGREFMSEPGPHDEESPVEYDDKTSDDNQKGVGKEQQGKDPEGKPKGSTGKTEAQAIADDVLNVNEAESPKGAVRPERCPHCEGLGYTDDEGNPQSYDTFMSRREDRSNPVHVCHECKGTGQLATARASTYRSGVERSVSRTLGRPWKFEARHKAGCQCGFCKNMGSFKARPKSGEDTESGGGDSGDSTSDSSDLKDEAQEEVPYVDKTGKSRKVPWVRKPKAAPKAEAEPPRYDDMYQMISERKQKTQKVKKAYKLRRK